jgi:hypothetical protein
MLEAARFADDLQEFRDERVAAFESGETPLPVFDGPKLMLHLVPISAFSPGQNIDRKTAGVMYKTRPQILSESADSGGLTDNYTVNSVIVHQGGHGEELYEYVRTFTSGIIEMYTSWPFEPLNQDTSVLDVEMISDALEATLPIQLRYLESQDIDPPIYACMSLLNAEGYNVDTGFTRRQRMGLDSPMQLPEVLIESYDAPLEEVCDQLVEYLYNADGQAGPNSQVYD